VDDAQFLAAFESVAIPNAGFRRHEHLVEEEALWPIA
jgi:hypothetical protein